MSAIMPSKPRFEHGENDGIIDILSCCDLFAGRRFIGR
jgi:hypothetical protein